MNKYNFGDIVEAVSRGVIIRGEITDATFVGNLYHIDSRSTTWWIREAQIIGVVSDVDEPDVGWGQGEL